MPSPVASTVQQVTNATPLRCASSSCLATVARSTALRITASAPWRSALSNAFCSRSGEPSVAIFVRLQPRSAAPWARMSPWISHACTPQLMKTTFLPLGMALPTGPEIPTLLGRTDAFATSDCASASPAAVAPPD